MEFYRWVERTMSNQTVIPFPEVGINFLEQNLPPKSDPIYDFNNKLSSFIKQLIPTEDDIKARKHIIDMLCKRIKEALSSQIQNFIILPCGSSLSGTFLTEADIDLAFYVYPTPCEPSKVMDILMDRLADLAIDQTFQPIPQAKVPVLKFIVEPKIQIDISIDSLYGPLNVRSVRKMFTDIPCILPAQLFLKFLLHRHKLDQPYTGGISSYTLQLMLIAYVQYFGIPQNITSLIDGFCDFYGSHFNFTLTGIDVCQNGCFFSRYKENKLSLESPTTLYIIDPLNKNNVLGHNAFRMNQIRIVFAETHKLISEGKGEELLNNLKEELENFQTLRYRTAQYISNNFQM